MMGMPTLLLVFGYASCFYQLLKNSNGKQFAQRGSQCVQQVDNELTKHTMCFLNGAYFF
jgi:hypothetical protein